MAKAGKDLIIPLIIPQYSSAFPLALAYLGKISEHLSYDNSTGTVRFT